MNIEQEIARWDGKSAADISAVFERFKDESSFVTALIDLSNKNELQKGTTWLLKRCLENGGSLSAEQVRRLVGLLPLPGNWEARLHVLQCISFVRIAHADRKTVERFLEKCLADLSLRWPRAILRAVRRQPGIRIDMASRTRKCILFLGTIALFSIGNAQDDAVPAVSQVPLQAMQRLTPLAGAWDMTVFTTSDDGATWNPGPGQVVNLQFAHKGFMLEEIPKALDGPGFHMRSYLTYDQYRKVYRKAALDDVWGILDLYEGKLEGDRLVLTNLESGTFFPVADGKWRGFRLTLELKEDNRWIWIDKTDDEGASWQPAFKIEYKRRKS